MVSGTSFQTTRDNLGNRDSTKDLVLLGPFNESIVIEEGPTRLEVTDTAGDGVWGIGFGNGTDNDGNWNDAGYTWQAKPFSNAAVVNRVINPANAFHEHFRNSDYINTTITTGDIDITTDFTINMEKGELYQTKAIFQDEKSINFVTPNIILTGGSVIFTATGTSKSFTIQESKNQFA